MINALIKLILFSTLLPTELYAQWERDIEVIVPRTNIYSLPASEWPESIEKGKKVALFYPVTASELLIPYAPLKTFFESQPTDPVRELLYQLARVASPFKSMEELYSWLGLHNFPSIIQSETPNSFPILTDEEKSHAMGATLIHTQNGEALTFGCAACHSADLFGVKVLGLTNRFPRANEFFAFGKQIAPYVNSFLFRDLLQTTEGERIMMVGAKQTVKWVGTKKPAVLGLDTSLAQVALSLAKRESDPYATRSRRMATKPRPNKLEKMVADSKPSVWWTAKYKNRWLSDGSIVSGNPIHTNFLWNEIGRGTDLKKLEQWMLANEDKIKNLTAAVFASQSPRYEKFFGPEALDIDKAKRGEKHYIVSCQKCHGTYEKAWSLSNSHTLTQEQLLQTTKVIYHKRTPVIDVGTDPGRYLGMKEFADDLNRLKISRTIGTEVVPQIGYVPPPLDGVWSRWPYLHNNSIPNLCALLTKSSLRPKTYFAGAAQDKARDYDQECAGYPIGDKTPEEWKTALKLFDSTKEGLSNQGHDEKIFLKDGVDIYSQEQKLEIIEFLKTL